MYVRMKGARRPWDLLEGSQQCREQPLSCCCTDTTNLNSSTLSGWTRRHVSPHSAHVTASSSGNVSCVAAVSIPIVSGGPQSQRHQTSRGHRQKANSCKSDHCGTTFCTPGHSRTKFSKISDPTKCKRKQVTPTDYQTGHTHSPHTTSSATNTQPKHTKTSCSRSTSKPTAVASSSYRNITDISFNISRIHRKTCFRERDSSETHIQHYISSYTYPQLEQRLMTASVDGLLCSVCAGASEGVCGGEGGEMGGGRAVRGVRVRPSIVQVLIEGSVLNSTSMPQTGSSHALPVIGLSHTNISHLSTDLKQTPSQLPLTPSPGSLLTLHTSSTTHTNTLQPTTHKHTCKKNRNTKANNSLSVNLTSDSMKKPPARLSSHSGVSQPTYNMRVQWGPEMFPPLVVPSTKSTSTGKKPAQQHTVNHRHSETKRKSGSCRISSHTDDDNGRDSLGLLIVSATTLNEIRNSCTVSTEGQTAQKSVLAEDQQGKRKPASTYAKSPHQSQTRTPNLLKTIERTLPPHNLDIRNSREVSWTSRNQHKLQRKAVNHHRRRCDSVKDSLYLEGRGAGRRRRRGESGELGDEETID